MMELQAENIMSLVCVNHIYLRVQLNDAVVFLLPLTMARCSLHTSIKLMAALTDDENNFDSHFSDGSILNRALKTADSSVLLIY